MSTESTAGAAETGPQGERDRAAPRPRRTLVAAVAAIAVAGIFAATTRFSISGHWQGLFLLHGKTGGRLELKDDLFLGDGPRLLYGVSFSRVRRLVSATAAPQAGVSSLELDWDEKEGNGVVRNHLADGTELVTLFGRYEDSEGATPRGLFVGGALPDIAADGALQNESGMAYRDARGWHHVWCNVNEGIVDIARLATAYPSAWRFLGSRVLVRDDARLVLESSHELAFSGTTLHMERFAYFRAGQPWFKLGVHIVNAGEVPVGFVYAYGDEPWVGEFGSAAGNVGWTASGIVSVEGLISPRTTRYAGIYDVDSQTANFMAWPGDAVPDAVYFSNRSGAPRTATAPLASNEIFIGSEWTVPKLGPGEARSVLLVLGLAEVDPAQGPRLPAGFAP